MARIVIIDDDELLAELLAEHLGAAGHMVSAVHDGAEADHAIRTSMPDLLILDYQLPDATGLSILRTLRETVEGAGVLVLMMTAKSGNLLAARARGEGVDDYLTKPVRPDMLLARVEALLTTRAIC